MESVDLPDDLQELMEYHGHLCFGVLLGYRACKYAVEIIGLAEKMTVVTASEDCANDAIRKLLGCNAVNGKLISKQGKKQSWAFYNHEEEEGVRLSPNPGLTAQMPKDKEQSLQFLLQLPGNLVFNVEPFNV